MNETWTGMKYGEGQCRELLMGFNISVNHNTAPSSLDHTCSPFLSPFPGHSFTSQRFLVLQYHLQASRLSIPVSYIDTASFPILRVSHCVPYSG